MARPRSRPSNGVKSSPASVKTTPSKRAASSTSTPLRQSKRLRSSPVAPSTNNSTPKKSVYFEHDTEESESESEVDNEGSGYEDEEASAVSSPEPSEDESEEYNSEEEEDVPRNRKTGSGGFRGRKKQVAVPVAMAAAIKSGKKPELWKEGVKVNGQGEVFIELPKARGPGKIPYRDDALHPNTLLFLGDLKRNNERAWLKMHDPDFRQAERDFKSFVEALTEKLIEKDETIPELPPKDLVFRIYRDVRFSSDPTPYKTHFAAAWSRTGRKGPYAAYYVHVAPGDNFVGGGLWCPEAEPLGKLRRAIDRKAQTFKRVLMEPGIRKEFLGGVGSDEKKVLKAFCGHNSGNALKRHPKVTFDCTIFRLTPDPLQDYTEDHPNIELLRLRNYTMGRKLKDDEVLGPGGLSRIVDLLATLTPFVSQTLPSWS